MESCYYLKEFKIATSLKSVCVLRIYIYIYGYFEYLVLIFKNIFD